MSITFWVWLAICVAALIGELSTMDLLSIWFVGGGLVALILSCFKNVAWYWQALAFALVSLLLLFAVRPIAKKVMTKDSEGNTNVDSFIGKKIRMITVADFDNLGSAKINDVVWSVKSFDGTPLYEEEVVEIVGIEGNKLVAKKVDDKEEKQ